MFQVIETFILRFFYCSRADTYPVNVIELIRNTIIGNQLIVPEIQCRRQKTGTILNRIFYGIWKSSFINISTVRTFLDFTAMFGNYDLNRRNFKFLSAFIVLNFSIFKIMATIFTTVWRMSYELIRSFNHFKSLSRMTFLATSFFATYCAATLRFRFFIHENISRRRFTAILAVLIQTGLYNLYTFFEFSNTNSLFFFYDILKSLDYRNYSFRTSFIDNKNLFTCKHNNETK